MRELLQQASIHIRAWHKKYGEFQPQWLPPAKDVELLEAIDEALSRSKWVKFSDALPIVPEGKFSTHIWCWRDGQKGKPYTSNFWAVGFKLSESAATHWQYRQDDTPAPPEAE